MVIKIPSKFYSLSNCPLKRISSFRTNDLFSAISGRRRFRSSKFSSTFGAKIMQNVDKLYMILDEMVVHGKIMGSSKTHILSPVQVLASS